MWDFYVIINPTPVSKILNWYAHNPNLRRRNRVGNQEFLVEKEMKKYRVSTVPRESEFCKITGYGFLSTYFSDNGGYSLEKDCYIDGPYEREWDKSIHFSIGRHSCYVSSFNISKGGSYMTRIIEVRDFRST